MEYTSSPVEHPATQTRKGRLRRLVFQDGGEDLRLQRLECLPVPEERRHVNEDVLVERADLLRMSLQQRQVALQALRAPQRHPARQPPFERRPLYSVKSTPTPFRTTVIISVASAASPADSGTSWAAT